MKRDQLEHVLRAAADVTKELEFLVIGSAAILATHDDDALPEAATRSDEADIAPFRDPEGTKGARIEIALGRGSRFFDTYQYSADAVDLTTAAAPDGWEGRLVRFQRPGTNGAVGWCLEAHDLAAAKLAAGRDKDYEFVEALLRERLIDALHDRPVVQIGQLGWSSVAGRSPRSPFGRASPRGTVEPKPMVHRETGG